MQEFILKMLMGIVMSAIPAQKIVDAIKELKADLADKVAATPESWDDMAVAALLSSEPQVIELVTMIQGMVSAKIGQTGTQIDDVLWVPVSTKLDEVKTLLLAA